MQSPGYASPTGGPLKALGESQEPEASSDEPGDGWRGSTRTEPGCWCGGYRSNFNYIVYGACTLPEYDPLFAFEVDHMSDAKYREYLEALGEDAVRHQLANQKLLMNGRDGLVHIWLAEKAMAREDAQDRRRLIIQILVVACGVVAATEALLTIKSWIG
jgi:hypothetical protein